MWRYTVGYAAGIVAFQTSFWLGVRGCQAMRLSSAQRKLATVAGLVIVPTCGIIAGHTMQFISAEFSTRAYNQHASPLLQRSHLNTPSFSLTTTTPNGALADHRPGPQWRQQSLSNYENVFYGIASLIMFRLAGGRLRYVAPSDIAKVGSFATKSLPARYNIVCDAGEKAKLLVISTHHLEHNIIDCW
jgi:hypothetical protein